MAKQEYWTDADLLRMGLVQQKDGSYSRRKFSAEGLKKKNYLSVGNPDQIVKWDEVKGKQVYVDQYLYTIEIKQPPTYFMVGEKKYYCTANSFYSTPHWTVRVKIVDAARAFLARFCRQISEPLGQGTTIEYIFSDKRKIGPKTFYDIDDRGFFWDKMFSDLLQKVKLVPNDNAYYFVRKIYRFDHKMKQNRLIIKIY